MARSIRFYETGGPEVLRLETAPAGEPGPGEARVRHSYVAVNYIDIYFRTAAILCCCRTGSARMQSASSRLSVPA
jgi:NADPH:quinone reductase-like Zn-dependent oxidoreductase